MKTEDEKAEEKTEEIEVSGSLSRKIMSSFVEATTSSDGPAVGDPTQFVFVRPMRASLNILSQPHGSVKLLQGDTCVLAAVFGPSDVRISKELPHRAAVDVLFRPKITGASQLSQVSPMDPTLEERVLESTLIAIFENIIYLEDHPAGGFNIVLQEYENDGCLLSACVNAVTLALLDGGCSIRSSVAGITIQITKDNKFIIDPCEDQLKKRGVQGLMTFVFSSDGSVLHTYSQGLVPDRLLKLGMQEARKAANEIFTFFHFLLTSKAQAYVVSRN